jgi:NAD+ synthase
MGLSIAFAQLNPTVGDVAGNVARVRRARDRARELGADLVVFSELVLVGYPPEDLVLRPALVDAAAAALRELERDTASGSPAVLVTLPWRANGCLHNAAALVADGRSEIRFKHELPTTVSSTRSASSPRTAARADPVPRRSARRADLRGHLVPARDRASRAGRRRDPARAKRIAVRSDKFAGAHRAGARAAQESGLPLAYVNQVGGQDELVFDGGSFVMNPDGTLAHLLPFWREAIASRPGRRRYGLPLRGRSRHGRAAASRRDLQRDDARPARLRRKNGFRASSSACPAASTRR